MSPELKDQILHQLASLPQEEQERVLAFARSLVPASGGIPGKGLLRFGGSFDPRDLDQMAKAMEEG